MLPLSENEMMKWYAEHPEAYNIEENSGMIYCLFSFPIIKEDGGYIEQGSDLDEGRLERIILLVYEEDLIIADCAGIHSSMQDIVFWQPAVEAVCMESDWMYLEHYTLCSSAFPSIPYPVKQNTKRQSLPGDALIYSNAYVTTSYRRHGIFRVMLEMMRDHALRHACSPADLYSVIALDPDVACYGPDAVEEQYIYSYEKDEPLRQRNCTIMQHVGFTPVKLEEFEPQEPTDGAKLWFALRHEHDLIIESEEQYS